MITEIPLPTIRRSINDYAPPVSRSALRKTGGSAILGKIQTALLGSIEPASTLERLPKLQRERKCTGEPRSREETSSETSQILGLTERTVKWHSTRAREAFGVGTTTQAVVEGVRRRLIHP
ncbi:hypothetical protein NKH28_33285 [Mesorhizobium sp. M1227]|uniref:hypothetical protein n=1 Tax=Mesorhizobium sp. M1227 TaxID=2957071 RepID=UPI003336AF5B